MRRVVLAITAAMMLFMPVTEVRAQMDMLPQIFRDLPPELQQGLPVDMTYREYRMLNRNVDFFTMFMSAWVPGYGYFQVEKPGAGWAIVGGRAAGTGMMVVAVARQWNNFRDIAHLSSIDETSYKRFLGNAFMFGGGIMVNGFLWAIDVIGAYRVAKEEKNFVMYKYGLKTSIGNAEDTDRLWSYVLRVSGQDDPRVLRDTINSLRGFVEHFPSDPRAARAEYMLCTAYAQAGEDAAAVMECARQIVLFPDPRFDDRSRDLAVRLIQENRSWWKEDWARLMDVFDKRAGSVIEGTNQESFSIRLGAFLVHMRNFQTAEFESLFLQAADDYVRQDPAPPSGDTVLFAAGEVASRRGEAERAVLFYSRLAAVYAGSDFWDDAVWRIAYLLDNALGQPEYAVRFYRRLVAFAPDSPYVARAKAALAESGGGQK